MRCIYGASFFVGLLCNYHLASSQGLADKKWYFGSSAANITFNRPYYTALQENDQATPFSTGGCAVATDPVTGNLLFYTDGKYVYDATHTAMPNGTNLNVSHVSTPYEQPVAISPVPGQEEKYYIFTSSGSVNTGGKTISVSVVDMSLSGNATTNEPPLGDVSSANTSVTGLTDRSEGMITIPHSNDTDYWLITQEVGSRNYSATLIQANTPFTNITSNGVGKDVSIARMAYSPISGKIAMSVLDSIENAFIVNFNNTTGTISFDRDIPNDPSFGSLAVHDVSSMAWSPNGQYLYLSKYGNNGISSGDVLQYDYNNPTDSLTSVLTSTVYGSYGLQVASDTAIYHLYRANRNGSILTGKLTAIDSAPNNVQYDPTPFGNTDFMGFLFPAFLPPKKVNLNVDFVVSDNICQNQSVMFFGEVTPTPDSLLWDSGDGYTGRGFSFMRQYSKSQTYTVSLTAFYNGQKKEVRKSITVKSFSLSISLVQDTTACKSEFPPPRGTSTPQPFSVEANVEGGTPASADWSNGDTGTTLTPDSAGYYYLVISDASGCSAYAAVNVREYALNNTYVNVWNFGNKAGMDFNPIAYGQPPKALDNSSMNAPEGTSTVSDRNGDLMFYTDGDKVYDKKHMEIASGIGGDPASAQAALIVPVEGAEDLYYIFTTKAMGNAGHELRYSLFDIKQNNGLGGIVIKNVLLYSQSTERIAANGSWLISHEYGNNTFRAYPLNNLGRVGFPVFSDIGSTHSLKSWQTGEGYMSLSPNNKLAVAVSNPGVSNIVEIFNFNNTNGQVSNYMSVNLNETNGQVYGVSFSPGGEKLFATLRNATSSSVYEYYFDTMGIPKQRNTVNYAGELGALQIAPNRTIYIAINGSNQLGTIFANENSTQNSAISFTRFSLLPGTQSGLGLPNSIQFSGNSVTNPNIRASNFCLGDTTLFTGTATDRIDNFAWDFGDGVNDDSSNPSHVYQKTGQYNTTLQLTNRCGLDTTLTMPVTIYPAAIKPTIPPTAVLCQDTISVLLDANINNLADYTYLWSTSDITKTLRIKAASLVSVTLTNAEGCQSTAETFVADNRPTVTLPPDRTFCANSIPSELDAGNPGAHYVWQVNGQTVGTGQTQSVDRSVVGSYLYGITITDPVTQCFSKNSTTVSLIESPLSADFEQSNPCLPTVVLTAKPEGNYAYSWYKESVLQNALSGNTVSLGLAEDRSNYAVKITNTTTGCFRESAIKRVDVVGILTVNLKASKACDDGKPFTLTADANVTDVTYNWFFNNLPIPDTDMPSISQFSEGTYKVNISRSVCATDADTVIFRLPIPDQVQLPHKLTICDSPENNNLQDAEKTLEPGGYDGYEWFRDDVSLGVTTSTLTVNSGGRYKVVVSNAHGCTNSGNTLIINDCIPIVEAPTAFRPSSEHDANKVFSLLTFFITDKFSVFIYNRWGELVYQSNDRFFKWDGTHQTTGESVPLGMYTYLLKYVMYSHPDRGIQEKRGGIMLVR